MMMPAEYTQEDYDAMPNVSVWISHCRNSLSTGLLTAVQLDFGTSYKSKAPVADEILFRVPISLQLAVVTTVIMIVVGVPLGVMCAVKQYSVFDQIVNVLSKFLAAIPGFWLGLMLILVFSVKLRWLPSHGMETWKSWVLPVFTFLLPYLGNYVRQVRSAMLDCIRQDYVRTSRAKGKKEWKVVFIDTLKNALLPIITLTGGTFATMIGGAVMIEQVFAFPGIGLKVLEGINNRDMPVILACSIILAIFTIGAQLIIDILYGIDIRIVRSTFVSGKKKNKVAKPAAEGGVQ